MHFWVLISGIFVLLMAARGAECGCAGSKQAVEGSIEADYEATGKHCAKVTEGQNACDINEYYRYYTERQN
uniref:Uncharacterized protein n=1 Tax=Globodera rostochiensis TaxID=31243 RepID=A0A914I8R2_GLORO